MLHVMVGNPFLEREEVWLDVMLENNITHFIWI